MKIFSLRTKLFPAFIGVRPRLLMLLLFAFAFTGCAEVMDQIDKMANFAKCQFRLASVENTALAGIPLQSANLSDISPLNLIKLQTVFTSGTLPLGFTLNLEVKNPNSSAAGMNKVEWILLMDNNQLTSGALAKAVDIPANGVGNLPMDISLDLRKTLSGKTLDSMINLALNVAGEGNKPSKLTLQLKPSIQVSGQTIDYPDYITVSHEFTSK